jgi:hypothetical protein
LPDSEAETLSGALSGMLLVSVVMVQMMRVRRNMAVIASAGMARRWQQ